MDHYDKLLDPNFSPSFTDLSEYIEGSARDHWADLSSFIEQTYRIAPQITYSKCSGKSGWNVKYHKSGKSLCVLYPEKESFTVLVVVGKDTIPEVDVNLLQFSPYFVRLYQGCTLFNGTYWLMIHVTDQTVAEDVKRLLQLKIVPKK